MKRAFTLIELLVVIAIIAILAAILFPVFAQAKAAAKKSVNISNHKQLATAILMYQGDGDDQFPLAFTVVAGFLPDAFYAVDQTHSIYSWQNTVQPYAKNWGIMVDPISPWQRSDPVKYIDPFLNYGMPPRSEMAGVPSWADTWWTPTGSAKWQGLTGIGQDDAAGDLQSGVGMSYAPTPTPSASQTSVASPAGMIMASDATYTDWWVATFGAEIGTDTFDYCITYPGVYNNGTTGATTGPWARYNPSDSSWCSGNKQYKGNLTTAFVDGHAKSVSIGETFKTSTNSAGDKVYIHLWPSEAL